MIYAVTVTNYLGDSIKLELAKPEDSGFIVQSITGLGAGKVNVNVTEVATNDGGIFNSARMPTRNIVMSLRFMFKENIEDVRHLSYKYFPLKKNVELKIETDSRTLICNGWVESNDPEIFSKEEGSEISILCPDPLFYADTNQETVFYGIEPMFEFPFSNESLKEPLLIMGEILYETTKTIWYEGDNDVGVTITIYILQNGVKNITIYNLSARQIMRINTDKLAAIVYDVDNNDASEKTIGELQAGDEIVLCTVKGKKGIILRRGGREMNILNCLDKNPDWFTLSKGENIFAYKAEQGSERLELVISNQIAYEGV